MYWLERNLSQDQDEEGSGNDDKKEHLKQQMSSSVLSGKSSKKLSDIWNLNYATNRSGSGDVCERESGLRRVSFAPCDQEVGVEEPPSSLEKTAGTYYEMPTSFEESSGMKTLTVQPPPVLGGNAQSTSDSDMVISVIREGAEEMKETKKHCSKTIYYTESRLPSRTVSPPSPPPPHDIRQNTQRSTSITDYDLLNRRTQSDDDCLSYNIKKKLLTLKLKEEARKQALLGPSSGSEINEKKYRKRRARRNHPLFHSTPDTEDCSLTDESNPTVYYSPKQSFASYSQAAEAEEEEESEMPIVTSSLDRKSKEVAAALSSSIDSEIVSEITSLGDASASNSAHSDSSHNISANSSSSAPSFLINSSTQLCQCIGLGDESNNKFKALLDKLTGENVMPPALSTCNTGKDRSAESPEVKLSSCDNSFDYHKSNCKFPSYKAGDCSRLDDSSRKNQHSCTDCIFDESAQVKQSSEEATILPDDATTPVQPVDEEWWAMFDKSYPDEQLAEISAEKAYSSSVDDNEEEEESAMESPRVIYQRIDLDNLLSQIYPEDGSIGSTPNDDSLDGDDDTAGVTTANSAEPAAIEDAEEEEEDDCTALRDLVDFLCKSPEPAVDGDVTTYAQREMSLECTGEAEEDSCFEMLLQQDTPSPQHISIEMSSELEKEVEREISFKTTTVSHYSNSKSPSVQDGHSGIVMRSTSNSSFVLKCVLQDSPPQPCVCGDLIDIHYDQGKETSKQQLQQQQQPLAGETGLNLTENPPETSEEWTDISEDYLLALPNDESCDSKQITLQECSDLLLVEDENFRPSQKKLMFDFKREVDPSAILKNVSQNSADTSKGTDASLMESLCSVSHILEKSHDSLAKSMHGLSRRAIIKQSNISLELVLPSEGIDAEGEEEAESCFCTCIPPLRKALNVQMNSSIDYSPSKGQAIQKVKRD